MQNGSQLQNGSSKTSLALIKFEVTFPSEQISLALTPLDFRSLKILISLVENQYS